MKKCHDNIISSIHHRFSFRFLRARCYSHVISSFGNNSPARRVTNQKHLVVRYINDTIGGRHITFLVWCMSRRFAPNDGETLAGMANSYRATTLCRDLPIDGGFPFVPAAQVAVDRFGFSVPAPVRPTTAPHRTARCPRMSDCPLRLLRH
jgi:hypothetical protein